MDGPADFIFNLYLFRWSPGRRRGASGDLPAGRRRYIYWGAENKGVRRAGLRAILIIMQLLDPTSRLANDPRSVKVNLTAGTGVEVEWKDGHRSIYTFPFLRDACPCALCDDEREKSGRKAGEAVKLAPGALPMFKASAKPLSAEQVGKYALRFAWNDNHDLGIYSWSYLREICPCELCRSAGG